MTTQHGHEEDITLDIAPIGKHEILLRLPWCHLHQVQFNWQQGDISHWGPNCEKNFPKTDHEIMLGHATQKDLPPTAERHAELRKTILEEYHDYLDVFDAEYSMSKCPEH